MHLFLDTEFTDFTNTELISIGLVSEDGKHEFYREVTHQADFRSDFVNKIVMPLLEGNAKTADWVALDLKNWLDSLPAETVTIVCDYVGDWHLVMPLLAMQPKRRVKIVAQMLRASFDEACTWRQLTENAEVRIFAFNLMFEAMSRYYSTDPRQHHALVDAKSNRHGWVEAIDYVKSKS